MADAGNYETLEEIKEEAEYDEFRQFVAEKPREEIAQALLSATPNEHTTLHEMICLYDCMSHLLQPTDSNAEVLQTAEMMIGADVSVAVLEENHTKLIRNTHAMSGMFANLYPLAGPLKKVLLDQCERMAYTIRGYFGTLYNMEMAKAETSGAAMSILRASKLEHIDFGRGNDLNDTQKVVRKFLELCGASFLRKDADIDEKDPNPMLYRPVFSDDGKTYVFSYEKFMGMRQFIYTCTKRCQVLWAAATKNAKTIPAVLREMKCTQEDLLPAIDVARNMWAYRNGVFNVEECKFYYHQPPTPNDMGTGALDPLKVCVHYIDQDLPYKEMLEHSETGEFDSDGKPIYDFRKIPTPTVERIMDSQDWNRDVRTWLYGLIFGRQFLPLKTKDQWEIYTLLLGEGGTGKSTLLKLFMMYYPIEMIGILNSESRNGFPLMSLYDKLAVVCTECGHLDLSTQKFCALTAAERMGIEMLFKKDVSINWSAPLLMAGNSPPNLSQEGDAVGRRTVAWLFKNVVKQMDPNLFFNLRTEMAVLQLKGALLYHTIYNEFGHLDLWQGFSDSRENVLPRYFHSSRREVQAMGCPIAAFFDSDAIERGAGKHCAYGEFMARFDEFCEQWKVNKRPAQTAWRSAFSRYNISLVDPRPNSRRKSNDPNKDHHGYEQEYLDGVALVGSHVTPAAEYQRDGDEQPPEKRQRVA